MIGKQTFYAKKQFFLGKKKKAHEQIKGLVIKKKKSQENYYKNLQIKADSKFT